MSSIISLDEIKVGLNFGDGIMPVGRLAMRERTIYFEYDRAFIEGGLEISPLRLPLKSGVSSFDLNLFEGLPGVFNDSLPDGWGRLLFDRFARARHYSSGSNAFRSLGTYWCAWHGALVFEPDHSGDTAHDAISLDNLTERAQDVLDGTSDDVLQELLVLNGSSAGARPKVLIGVNHVRTHIVHGAHDLPDGYAPWLVKFANSQDGLDAGAIEYAYALMTKEAGINMPDVYLFPAQKGAGYFAINV